jgi:hypothetical protein
MRPTRVTVAETGRLLIELGSLSEAFRFSPLGFERSEGEQYKDLNLFGFRSPDENCVFRMCETLRDMGIPFTTHRTGGADYFIEVFRERGRLSGRFKRINFFGNDFDDEAPFAIEEF